MYQRIDEAELMAFGLSADDFEHESVEIWPDCIDAYMVFDGMNTQWMTNMGGVTGMVYASIPVVCQAVGVELCKDLLSDLRVMEVAAIKEINKKD